MMDAAEIHRPDRGGVLDQPAHRLDVAGQQNPRTLVGAPLLELAARVLRRREVDVHLGGDAHAIELLLPLASRHFVIDEDDEPEIERLTPPDDDLAVNEAVVDAIEINGHAGSPERS